MNQQYINLIVVVLIAGSSAFSWIFRKLAEQAALKKAEAERERRRIEALRTGRGDPDDADQARARVADSSPGAKAEARAGRAAPGTQDLEQLAKRRAEQLRQLRELQLAKQRAAGSAKAPPRSPRDVIVSVPGSSGPTVPGTRSGGNRPGTRPEARTTSRSPLPAPSGAGQSRTEERRAKQARKAELESLRRAESEALARKLAAVPSNIATSARANTAPTDPSVDRYAAPKVRASPLAGMTRADWKRAFLAKEVLGDPVSMRTDHLK